VGKKDTDHTDTVFSPLCQTTSTVTCQPHPLLGSEVLVRNFLSFLRTKKLQSNKSY